MKTTGLAVTTTASTSTAATTVTTSSSTSTSTLVHEPNHTGPDSQGVLTISGSSFTSALPVVDVLMDGGTVWIRRALLDEQSNQSSAAPTPTDSVTSSYRFSCSGAKLVRAYCTSGTLTTCRLEITTGTNAEFGATTVNVSNPTSTGASTVNVSSATAFVVGPNGTTNPTFQVVTNVASEATGVKVTGAAAAGGVAVAAISSGTDESLKVDAKGAGIVAINDTATGTTYLNRGGLKSPHIAKTLTALGTTQSSTPTSAQLLGGMLSQTGQTGAGTVTLPTGTALTAACARAPVVGDTFDCDFFNLGGSQTLTITGATGTTVVGTAAVGTGKNAKITFYASGSNTWNVYVNVSA